MQPEHGFPMTEASHLTRLLLHLSQAWGLRELRLAPRGAAMPLVREPLDRDVSIFPSNLPIQVTVQVTAGVDVSRRGSA